MARSPALRTPPAYTLSARVLHWLTALLVFIMVPLGIIIANEWGGSVQEPLYNLHKSIGALVLAIMVVRIIYRLVHPPPPLPADIPAVQQLAAHGVHWLLYALLVIQPLIGWIATSAYPAPLPVFGMFDLPRIWVEDRTLSERLFMVHRWLGISIAGVVALHIAAALHHHFVRKDRTLMRMIAGS
ncbi:MAG: cytochrome b [Xanthobacteraceae bacterium]